MGGLLVNGAFVLGFSPWALWALLPGLWLTLLAGEVPDAVEWSLSVLFTASYGLTLWALDEWHPAMSQHEPG